MNAQRSDTMDKTLNNTTAKQAKDQVKDLEIWGDGDMWKLLCKASSQDEGWMKSTKAMEISGVGCLIQVTTQQIDGNNNQSVAEAVTFVPDVVIYEEADDSDKIVFRELRKAHQPTD